MLQSVTDRNFGFVNMVCRECKPLKVDIPIRSIIWGDINQRPELVIKYGASFLSGLSLSVKDSSSIGTASAVILLTPFRPIVGFIAAPSFRARASTAIVDKGNQIIQTTHNAVSHHRSNDLTRL